MLPPKIMKGIPIQASDSTLLPLPPQTIWPHIADLRNYPQWWPAVLLPRVTTPAEGTLIGSELHLRPMGARQFTCKVVACTEPHLIELEYTGPFITGCGQWLLAPEGQGTRVSYVIDVQAHGYMVALASRCVDLRWVHGQSMRLVFTALRKRLFAG